MEIKNKINTWEMKRYLASVMQPILHKIVLSLKIIINRKTNVGFVVLIKQKFVL